MLEEVVKLPLALMWHPPKCVQNGLYLATMELDMALLIHSKWGLWECLMPKLYN